MRPSILFAGSAVVFAGTSVLLFENYPQIAGTCAYVTIIMVIYAIVSFREEQERRRRLKEHVAYFDSLIEEIKNRKYE